jgi:excisionase family DNA binding protein
MDLQRGTLPAAPHRKTRRETPKPVSTTVDDACRVTGLGRTKIYQLISEGKLRTKKIGRRRLIMYASIEALMGDAT